MTGPEQSVSPPRSLARPRALRPGDRLAVLCVSGPVDPGPLAAGLDALRFAGLDPVTYPSLTDPGTMRPPYLAGDDAVRAADLRAALTDPGIAGHGGSFQTFPLGIAAELDADRATLRLLDPPLS